MCLVATFPGPKHILFGTYPLSNANRFKLTYCSLPHETERWRSKKVCLERRVKKCMCVKYVHISYLKSLALLDRLTTLNTISPEIMAIKGGKYEMSDSRILDLSGRKVPVVYRYLQNEVARTDIFNRCGFLQETRNVL